MADLVYKLHRDEGGWGIAPPDPFFQVVGGDESASIYWEVADKTVIDKQTVCHTKGVMIRRSLSPIETEHEGELIVDTEELSGYLRETGLTNEISYYYKCFPYSDHAVYNRGKNNQREVIPSYTTNVNLYFTSSEVIGCKIEAKKGGITYTATVDETGKAAFKLGEIGNWRIGGQLVEVKELNTVIDLYEKIYGYDWDLIESDPESNISYPETVENAEYAGVSATTSLTNISIGDWEGFVDWLGVRPVILSFGGAVYQELDPSDQSKDTDGNASYYNSTGEDVNAMVEFPKRYFKRWTDEDGHYAHFRVSRVKLGDDWKCYPWMYGSDEETAHENDNIYLSMTNGVAVSKVMRSISISSYPAVLNYDTLSEYISVLGDGWMLDDLSNVSMITDYMFMMGKSTDVQSHWGTGVANEVSSIPSTYDGNYFKWTGFYGRKNSYSVMKFMWLINWYGYVYNTTLGLYAPGDANELYVKDFPPYLNDDGDMINHKSLGRGIDKAGYISKVTYDEHGMIPQAGGGSASTYIPDTVSVPATNRDVPLRWARGGDYAVAMAGAGLTMFFHLPTITIGCRLTYKSPVPPIE